MYRTHLFLLKYCLPLLLLVGMGLTLWQIQVPWYVPVVFLPVAALLIVILVGSVALARERRAAPARAESRIIVAMQWVDPSLARPWSGWIVDEPTEVPPLPGPEALVRELENDPDLLRAFGLLSIALADPQVRPEVLRALDLFARAAKNRK